MNEDYFRLYRKVVGFQARVLIESAHLIKNGYNVHIKGIVEEILNLDNYEELFDALKNIQKNYKSSLKRRGNMDPPLKSSMNLLEKVIAEEESLKVKDSSE